jgi:LL-diaminopimelate aminotransferase
MQIAIANRIRGIEEYYFSKKLQEIDQMRRDGLDIINLGIGSPDLAPSSATISRLYEESTKSGNHGYQSYRGIPELRKAFSLWYERFFQVNLDPGSEILPLMGSKEGIVHISMAFINPGDEVLIPNPGYPTYESATKLAGGVARHYELSEDKGWLPDLQKMKLEGLEKVKIMWVNYPHMPTGTNATTDLFADLISFGLENNILICNDNPYSFILNDNPLSILSINGSETTALELNSLSKSHNMAGWRIGMVAGNGDFIHAILKVKSNMDSGMFRAMQLAAVEALSAGKGWYDELNEVYRGRQQVACEILDILGCRYDPEQIGMFVWGQIPENYHSASELSDKLLNETGVFITPGMVFGSQGEKYLRISLCSDLKILKTAKERISKIL